MEHNPHAMQQQHGMEQQYYQLQNVAPEKGAAPYHDAPYQQHQQHPDPYGTQYPPVVSKPVSTSTGQTVKRGLFFAVIGIALILAALVIGLGAGLGVTQNKLNNVELDLSAARASLTAVPTKPTSATPTASKTSPPTASATPDVDCPASNNTIYIASNGAKQFNRFCGIDYSGDGADDLDSVKAKSMEACIDACASEAQCQGCGWGVLEAGKAEQSCYLKTNLTKSHNATAEWGFAVLALPSS